MWLCTTTGFYSAVAHKNEKDLLVVRSRVLQDSEALAAWTNLRRLGEDPEVVEVVAYQQSDYPWRVIIRRTEWAAFVAAEATSIDYTNYKNAVTAKQGRERHDIYSRVWSALLALEKLPGAMREHGKRAVPHPLWGARRAVSDDLDAWFMARQPAMDSLWDRFGGEDEPDDDPPYPGDPGHEDCTDAACEADDGETCCA